MPKIVWSEYLQYRARLRSFDLAKIEEILRFLGEKYYDTITDRLIVVGKHNKDLIMIPYEINEDLIIPVTVHSTTRQQIKFRLKNGRFIIHG